jgi:dinuclear metal center YbgI/SA1388 family protein
MLIKDIIAHIESNIPIHLAESYDNVGLLVGDLAMDVGKIYLTLDPTMAVIEDAIEKGADMIIAHHPYGLGSFNQVNSTTIIGQKLLKLIQNNIALYVAHTNLDRSNNTINEIIFNRLGLSKQSLFVETHATQLYKLVAFVPESHLDYVREAINDAGAGHIGGYSHCSFYQAGTGTFKPDMGTEPYIGEIGELEKVSEIRIETVIPEGKIDSVISALLEVHPYEEVAYDMYKIERTINPLGFGLMGYTDEPVSLENLIESVKKELHLGHVQYVGELDRYVQKIAICSGSGTDFMEEAYKNEVDVFITGDVRYHYATDAQDHGLALIDASHYGTEQIVVTVFEDLLQPLDELDIIVDQISKNPLKML